MRTKTCKEVYNVLQKCLDIEIFENELNIMIYRLIVDKLNTICSDAENENKPLDYKNFFSSDDMQRKIQHINWESGAEIIKTESMGLTLFSLFNNCHNFVSRLYNLYSCLPGMKQTQPQSFYKFYFDYKNRSEKIDNLVKNKNIVFEGLFISAEAFEAITGETLPRQKGELNLAGLKMLEKNFSLLEEALRTYPIETLFDHPPLVEHAPESPVLASDGAAASTDPVHPAPHGRHKGRRK